MPGRKTFTVSKDGPYLVSGSVPLAQQIIHANKDREIDGLGRGRILSCNRDLRALPGWRIQDGCLSFSSLKARAKDCLASPTSQAFTRRHSAGG